MALRLGAVLPRLALVAVFLLGGTASLAFATQQQLTASHVATAASPAPAQQQTMRVPDVRGQAYVFAKGILEDAGFAWRVSGARGYATNVVAAEFPAPGVKVADTGAPLIRLTLVRNPKYKQLGTPEDASTYPGTSVLITSGGPTRTTTRAAATTTSGATTTAATTTETAPAAHAKLAPKPSTPSPAKPAAATKPAYPQHRPPAFVAAGAPKEPLDEMPLPDRARLLQRWVAAHPSPTSRNVRHWLYQHAWILDGATFGWWRGAEALRTLIDVDRSVEAKWGVGHRSELAARRALAVVEAKSK